MTFLLTSFGDVEMRKIWAALFSAVCALSLMASPRLAVAAPASGLVAIFFVGAQLAALGVLVWALKSASRAGIHLFSTRRQSDHQ
jgi:hypothetical protein